MGCTPCEKGVELLLSFGCTPSSEVARRVAEFDVSRGWENRLSICCHMNGCVYVKAGEEIWKLSRHNRLTGAAVHVCSMFSWLPEVVMGKHDNWEGTGKLVVGADGEGDLYALDKRVATNRSLLYRISLSGKMRRVKGFPKKCVTECSFLVDKEGIVFGTICGTARFDGDVKGNEEEGGRKKNILTTEEKKRKNRLKTHAEDDCGKPFFFNPQTEKSGELTLMWKKGEEPLSMIENEEEKEGNDSYHEEEGSSVNLSDEDELNAGGSVIQVHKYKKRLFDFIAYNEEERYFIAVDGNGNILKLSPMWLKGESPEMNPHLVSSVLFSKTFFEARGLFFDHPFYFCTSVCMGDWGNIFVVADGRSIDPKSGALVGGVIIAQLGKSQADPNFRLLSVISSPPLPDGSKDGTLKGRIICYHQNGSLFYGILKESLATDDGIVEIYRIPLPPGGVNFSWSALRFMRKLLKSSEALHDLYISGDNGKGKPIGVHKAILVLRAPKFLEYLNLLQKNLNAGTAEKPLPLEYKTSILESILRCIYTEEFMEDETAELCELWKLAQAYSIDLLLRKCEHQILKVIRPDNAIQICQTAIAIENAFVVRMAMASFIEFLFILKSKEDAETFVIVQNKSQQPTGTGNDIKGTQKSESKEKEEKEGGEKMWQGEKKVEGMDNMTGNDVTKTKNLGGEGGEKEKEKEKETEKEEKQKETEKEEKEKETEKEEKEERKQYSRNLSMKTIQISSEGGLKNLSIPSELLEISPTPRDIDLTLTAVYKGLEGQTQLRHLFLDMSLERYRYSRVVSSYLKSLGVEVSIENEAVLTGGISSPEMSSDTDDEETQTSGVVGFFTSLITSPLLGDIEKKRKKKFKKMKETSKTNGGAEADNEDDKFAPKSFGNKLNEDDDESDDEIHSNVHLNKRNYTFLDGLLSSMLSEDLQFDSTDPLRAGYSVDRNSESDNSAGSVEKPLKRENEEVRKRIHSPSQGRNAALDNSLKLDLKNTLVQNVEPPVMNSENEGHNTCTSSELWKGLDIQKQMQLAKHFIERRLEEEAVGHMDAGETGSPTRSRRGSSIVEAGEYFGKPGQLQKLLIKDIHDFGSSIVNFSLL